MGEKETVGGLFEMGCLLCIVWLRSLRRGASLEPLVGEIRWFCDGEGSGGSEAVIEDSPVVVCLVGLRICSYTSLFTKRAKR